MIRFANDQICESVIPYYRFISDMIFKKNKKSTVKPFMVKNHVSVFVNALIENPAFDSQVCPNEP